MNLSSARRSLSTIRYAAERSTATMPATRTSAFVLFVAFTVAMTPEAVSQSRTGGTSSSRKCSTLREPRRLPPVDQVVDSTALVAQLSTLPASYHGAEVVFSPAHAGDSTSKQV